MSLRQIRWSWLSVIATCVGVALSAEQGAALDTAPPPHPGLRFFGYYNVIDSRYGNFADETFSYTNLVITGPGSNSLYAPSLQIAAAAGKRIMLLLSEEPLWEVAVTAAAPFWDNVDFIEVLHEDDDTTTAAALDEKIGRLEALLAAKSLTPKIFGATYTFCQQLGRSTGDPVTGECGRADPAIGATRMAKKLTWIGLEVYPPIPGNPSSDVNVRRMLADLTVAKRRVPAGKRIVLVGMGYDRNGAWTTAPGGPGAAPVNVASLRDLQMPTYLGGHDDTRVIALVFFSYGRPGGTRTHPELKAPHQEIGARILAAAKAAEAGKTPR